MFQKAIAMHVSGVTLLRTSAMTALMLLAHVPAWAANGGWTTEDAATKSLLTPTLRAELAAEAYTDEEKRNISTAIGTIAVDPDATLPAVLATAKIHRTAMADLAQLSGFPKGDAKGYDASSVPDRRNVVQDIVAKDNRLAMMWRWEGHQKGSFFGVAGDGKKISSREFAVFTFDRDGKPTDVTYGSEEVNIAMQVGIPIKIDASTAAKYPVPPLALAANNPIDPKSYLDWLNSGLGKFLDGWEAGTWPPSWPAGVAPDVQARMASGLTPEEKLNLRAIMAYSYFMPVPYIMNTVARRNGMTDLGRYAGAKIVSDQGYASGFTVGDAPDDSMAAQVTMIDDLIVKGDKGWVLWRWYGNHTGCWFGVAGNGRPVLGYENGLFKLRNGSLLTSEMVADELQIAQQVGENIEITKPVTDFPRPPALCAASK